MKYVLFFKNFLDTPKNYYNNIILNVLGFQVLRYLFHNFIHFIFKQSKSINIDNDKKYFELKKEGITVIENCFSDDDFKIIANAFDSEIKQEQKIYNKDNTGLNWSVLTFDSNTFNNKLKNVYDIVFKNQKIQNIISKSLNIKDIGKPLISFQMLENPDDNDDDKDIQLALHSDRFFPCFKLYLSVESNDIENGAYMYSKRSHRFSFKRLFHEYEFSIRNALFNSGFKIKKDFEYSRCVPKKKYFKNLYANTESIITKKNTVVISNNKGFHSRGKMEKGTIRKQIRIVYYYLQRPIYYNFFKKIYNFAFK